MSTFVLVPGAWLGGWCWRRLTPLLRAAGHEVYTPTLTGLGERVHLGTLGTWLDTHVEDIVNVLAWEDLREIVLVGHSYSGMVVPGVADRAPECVGHLVYLDAVVPRDGQSVFNLSSSEEQAVAEVAARDGSDGWRVPVPSDFGPADTRLTEADERWFRSKGVGQPIKTYADPLPLTNPGADAIPHTYIWCSATGWLSSSGGARGARLSGTVPEVARLALPAIGDGTLADVLDAAQAGQPAARCGLAAGAPRDRRCAGDAPQALPGVAADGSRSSSASRPAKSSGLVIICSSPSRTSH
jgi:pimeloyl-ACP methyl ester carboxylesterase